MKLAGIVIYALLLLATAQAWACSPVTPQPVDFQPTLANPGDHAPKAPRFTVQVRRGDLGNGADSCADLGMIRLSIPATRANLDLLFAFEILEGQRPSGLSDYGPSRGAVQDEEIVFLLPWVDRAPDDAGPLTITLRATPYRRSGQRGTAADIVITAPAR